MARAKLSGSLLVSKGAPLPNTPAQQPALFRSMAFGSVAVAISFLAMASVSGWLLLQLNEARRSTEPALIIASPMKSEPAPAIPVAVASSEGASAEMAVVTRAPEPGALPPAAAGSASAPATGPAPTVPAVVESPGLPTTTGAPATPVAVIAATPATDAVAAPFRQTESDASAQASARAAQPATVPLPAGQVAALLARGDMLFSKGDTASARLFYQRAAEAGSSQAALQLGETYDPEFLVRTHLNGVRGDPAAAAHWYGRARELGAPDADILLSGIIAKKDQQP
jgi:hypothetical protein